MAAKVRLGDLLVNEGLISREQLGNALRHQGQSGGRLGTNLVELGFVDERTLAGTLAKQLQIPAVTKAQLAKIPPEVLRLVPGPLAARLGVVPVRVDAGRLWLAMSDPTDREAADEIARLTKKPVRPLVAPDMLIQLALEQHYKVPRRPRRNATPSFDIDVDGPLHEMPQAVTEEPAEELEVQLDDADVATGFLDDEPLPAMPARFEELSFPDLLSQIVSAGSDEVVLDAVLRFLAPRAARLAVLMLHSGELRGVRGLNVDREALSRVRVALRDLPLGQRALDSGQSYAGRIELRSLGELARPFGLLRDVLGFMVPVRIGRQPVGVIIGVEASSDIARRKPELDKLAIKIDQALHINHLKRLLLAP